jgi:hypothetical protein
MSIFGHIDVHFWTYQKFDDVIIDMSIIDISIFIGKLMRRYPSIFTRSLL